MSKVKELLEREQDFKNWTLDEVYELSTFVQNEWTERDNQKIISNYLNQATSFNEFKLLVRNAQYFSIKEIQDDMLMSMWIDFIEGKDNSK